MQKKRLQDLRDQFLLQNEQGLMPLPRIIHVETRSRCNGTCHFCPASANHDTRGDQLMPDALIQKIVSELSELDYPNRLSFYNNNEPFLDKRIYEIIALARQALPKAFLELKSNGVVLSTESVLKIFNAGLDMLYINDYSKNKAHRKNVEKIKNELPSIRRFGPQTRDKEHFDRIHVELRDVEEVLGSRAGNAPNRKAFENPYKSKLCLRPCEMMTVDPKGDVSVCSEDYDCSINMGNVSQEKLWNIWNSENWAVIRRKLLTGDRSCTESCLKCDYRGFSLEMLSEHNVHNPMGGIEIRKKGRDLIRRALGN